MSVDRRTMLALAGSGAATGLMPASLVQVAGQRRFPQGFLWGAATAGHQIEGNNSASDNWALEHVKPTTFKEPSGDACNSFEMWPVDLDLVRGLGLNSYRFSLEWARIEPEARNFSIAMLDHYKSVIAGCHARGLTPVVTFNHVTVPRWFAARGGWTKGDSAQLFARFCALAARHLGDGIGYALTLNEPANAVAMKDLYAAYMAPNVANDAAAGAVFGSPGFRGALTTHADEVEVTQANLLAAHREGRNALKAARSKLAVGFSLALPDDIAVGEASVRDAKRQLYYGAWLELAREDDFLGVQNYDRAWWDSRGLVQPPAGVPTNLQRHEINPGSVAAAVRYAHAMTRRPILVTEHGIATEHDADRARFIADSIAELHGVVSEGIPLLGYLHWTLLDNFEWMLGYQPKYGLCSVDRQTFARTPKPSAGMLGAIAARNAV